MTTRKAMGMMIAVWIVAALAAGAIFGETDALNVMAGYGLAWLVLAASAYGYFGMVRDAAAGVDPETIVNPPECDDPHGLWEDEDQTPPAQLDPKAVMAAERARMKKRGWGEILRASRPALSLYRLGAYALMVWALVAMIDHGLFAAPAFLFGVTLAVATGAWLLRGLRESTAPRI